MSYISVEAESCLTKHQQIKELYGPLLTVMAEAESLYRGKIDVFREKAKNEIEALGTSRGRAIIDKMMKKIAIRSTKTYSVVQHNETKEEQAKCDLLERMIRSYYRKLEKATRKDVLQMATWYALVRGRGGIQTILQKGVNDPVIRQRALDPMEYFPARGEDGIEWYTTERWLSRWQVKNYCQSLEVELPDFKDDEDGLAAESIRVVEYWDKNNLEIIIAGHQVYNRPHNYDHITLQEVFYGQTPATAEEWRSQPILYPARNELKGYAVARTKTATGMQEYLWPKFFFRDPSGNLQGVSTEQAVNDIIPVAAESTFEVIAPVPNQGLIEAVINAARDDIQSVTISESVFNKDVLGESGFQYQQFLGQIGDDLAHIRDDLERAFGMAVGDMLRLHEQHAPDEGWEYAIESRTGTERNLLQKITSDDIDGHYDVEVTVRPTLPDNTVQKVTIYSQLSGVLDPQTGKPELPLKARLRAAELDEVFGDSTEFDRWMKEERDAAFIAASQRATAAELSPAVSEMTRKADSAERKQEAKDLKRMQREIEEGLSEDLIIPAEVLADQMKMQQFLAYIAQGKMPKDALALVLSPPPTPELGQPPAQDGGDNINNFMMEMFGDESPDGQMGYGNGMSPEVAPAAMQGAMPRQAVNPAQLMADQMTNQIRRAALPPPA